MKQKRILKLFQVLFCSTILLLSCTKYTGTSTTSSSSSSSGSTAPTPLPPLAGGGSSSSGGSGSSSGSGSGSGSSTGTGTGTVNPNIPQSYIQAFVFTGTSSSYITMNDSISLKQDGSYTQVYNGSATLKYKVGSGASSDPALLNVNYFLRPYAFYTYVVYKNTQYNVAETMLYNDMTTPTSGTAQIRYVSLDPLTNTVPVKFRITSSTQDKWTVGRKYLDHLSDTSFQKFETITPGQSKIGFYYRDSLMLNFDRTFEAGKKYTVFANATNYVSTSAGQFPVSTYYVTQHN